MTFELLLNKLNSKSFEEICKEQKHNLVECINNEVYFDTDLEDFFKEVGATIEDFGVGYAVISTTNNKFYEVPYEEIENRFDSDLEDEIILTFELDKVYDITNYYI